HTVHRPWEGPCCELARAPNVNHVRPRTSTEDCERNTVSEGAKPVTNTAAVRGADEHPQSGSARRPVLAEVAAATRGPRRFVSRIGAIVPASFILITIAVSSSLGQPLRGGADVGELHLWAPFTLLLLTPFIAAVLVMLPARRGGWGRGSALVHAVVTGLLGVGRDATVFRSAFSCAAPSRVSARSGQAALLAPGGAAGAFLARSVCASAGA